MPLAYSKCLLPGAQSIKCKVLRESSLHLLLQMYLALPMLQCFTQSSLWAFSDAVPVPTTLFPASSVAWLQLPLKTQFKHHFLWERLSGTLPKRLHLGLSSPLPQPLVHLLFILLYDRGCSYLILPCIILNVCFLPPLIYLSSTYYVPVTVHISKNVEMNKT